MPMLDRGPAQPIVIAGDWHGDQGWALAVIRSAARSGAQTILHVGDFALDWPGLKRARYEDRLNRRLIECDIELIVSGGNHDNWDTLMKLSPQEDGLGTFRSNIRVLPRGGRAQIGGLTIGALGGAYSVDQEHRTEGKDWWANEEPSESEAQRLVDGGPVDVLLTHDAPAGVAIAEKFDLPIDVRRRADRTRTLLREVVDSLVPPHVFCGHWHQRRSQEIIHRDGQITRVDVLDKEKSRVGNAVLVWPGKAPLRVEPLVVRG